MLSFTVLTDAGAAGRLFPRTQQWRHNTVTRIKVHGDTVSGAARDVRSFSSQISATLGGTSKYAVFGHARRPTLHHTRWQRCDGGGLAVTTTSRRWKSNPRFSSKKGPDEQQMSKEKKGLSGRRGLSDPMDNAHKIGSQSIAAAGDIDKFMELEGRLQVQQKDADELKKKLQGTISELEEQLRQFQAESKKNLAQSEARFESVTRDAQTKAQDELASLWKRAEAVLEQARSNRAVAAAEAKDHQRAKEKIESQTKAQKQDNIAYLVEQRERLQGESAKENQDHQRRAERVLAGRFTDELRLIQDRRVARELERKDYPSYRDIWYQLTRALYEVTDSLRDIQKIMVRRVEIWRQAVRDSDLAKVDDWFSTHYPKIRRQVQEMVVEKHRQAEQALQQVKKIILRIEEEDSELRGLSHWSRLLTMHYKYKPAEDDNFKRSLVMRGLNEIPLVERRDELERKMSSTKRLMEASSSAHDRDLHAHNIRQEQKRRNYLGDVHNFYVFFRQREMLKAVQVSDTISAMAVLDVLGINRMISDASHIVGSQSKTIGKDGKAFFDNRSKLRDQRTEYQRIVRQRQILQESLGETPSKDSDFQQVLERAGQRAEANMERALDVLIGAKRDEGSSFRSSRPALHASSRVLRPAARATTTTTTTTRAAAVRTPDERSNHAAAIDGYCRKLSAVGKELRSAKSSFSKTNLEAKALKLRTLRCGRQMALAESNLSVLNRSSSADPKRRALHSEELAHKKEEYLGLKAQLVQAQIAARESLSNHDGSSSYAHKAAVDDASNDGTGTPFTPRILQLTGEARPDRKTTKRRRRKIARGPSVKGVDVSENEHRKAMPEAGASGPVVTFQPTDIKNAPRVFWPESPSWQHLATSWYIHMRHGRTMYSTSSGGDGRGQAQKSMPHTSPDSAKVNAPTRSDALNDERAAALGEHVNSESEHTSASADEMSDFMLSQSTDQSQSIGETSEFMPSQSTDRSLDAEAPSPQASNASSEVEEVGFGLVEDPTPLEYQIPPEDYRKAVLASANTAAGYWTHKLYKNAEGKAPLVYYCTTVEQAETRAKEFLEEAVIGFDIEWEIGHTPAKSGPKKNVSLIQIATVDKIALFHVALFKGDSVSELMPASLRTILESREVVKTGVNIQGDAKRLEQCLDVTMTGLLELSHLYKVVMYSESSRDLIDRKPFKLADQVQNILLLPLKKDAVRTSAWSKRLDMQQTEYAASDAYAGFRLYHSLEAKRHAMVPKPPRPAFYEEHKPIQLGDGTVVQPKTRKKVVPKAAEAGEEDEEEEFFDAVETQDAYDLGGGSAPVAASSISYPTLPSLESQMATLDIQGTAQPDSKAASKETPAPKPQTRPSPPEVLTAERWVAEYRATNDQTVQARTHVLRAWHMWHEQALDCKTIAGLLRDPPLALQSVATYVLEAVKVEGLDRDGERAREVLELLPRSVWGRYGGVIEVEGAK